MFTQGSGDLIASAVQSKSAVDQMFNNSSLSSSPKSVLPEKVPVDQVSTWNVKENNGETTDELLEPLLLCCESLQSCGSGILGMHSLEDCLQAWEILPKVNYAMSGYELEMLHIRGFQLSREQEKCIGKYFLGKFTPYSLFSPFSLCILRAREVEFIFNTLISLFVCELGVRLSISHFYCLV
ncbi:hypothetical protein PVL29_022854 [Vitis rotundifolia]|uniref:Uncharacterized protein n=1 Tax=Vitis rotundifolia TaxID=103349 RepID=A0AA38YWP3_VITRO|nr:hypothetical protein PVL29_022854 [Vitis rotundifolia]